MIFEFLELTRAFAVPYVCDCGVIWRPVVLGTQQLWTGARAHWLMGMLGCGTCLWLQRDVHVTPCATCSLEMERPQVETRPLPCKG